MSSHIKTQLKEISVSHQLSSGQFDISYMLANITGEIHNDIPELAGKRPLRSRKQKIKPTDKATGRWSKGEHKKFIEGINSFKNRD